MEHINDYRRRYEIENPRIIWKEIAKGALAFLAIVVVLSVLVFAAIGLHNI